MHLAPPAPRGAASLVACAFALTVLVTPASAQVRVFPTSGSGVLAGDVTAIGGTNGGYGILVQDVDGHAATSDSSSEVLTLPADATIRHATLVWEQDCIEPCVFTGAKAIDTTDFTASEVTVIAPDQSAHVVHADGGATWVATAGSFTLHGRWAHADVTALMQAIIDPAAATPQRVAVGNIAATMTGSGAFRNATWAIFVVYEAPAEPLRAVAVDLHGVGLPAPDGAVEVVLTIDNVQLPAAGPVSGSVAVYTADGQASLSVEENIFIDARVPAQALTNAANPFNGVWNHSISYLGVRSTTARPDPTTFSAGAAGIDLDTFDITGKPTPGANTIDLIATTSPVVGSSQEYVALMGVALSVDVQQPDLAVTKTATVLAPSGAADPTGVADPGDRVAYVVALENVGNDDAIDLAFSDPFPPGAAWVPGSLRVDGAPVADLDPAVTLTASALAVALGPLAVGGQRELAFELEVVAATAGAPLANVARVDYGGASSAITFVAFSDAAVVAACGNGLTEGPEVCDDGPDNGAAPCACAAACDALPDGAVACDDADPCTVDACDQGACAYQPAVGASCDDGLRCTEADACDATGACVGVEVTCGAPLVCDVAVCVEASGVCEERALSCEEPVFYGVVRGAGGALGSIRCWRDAVGAVACDMDGDVLAVGPPMCAAP